MSHNYWVSTDLDGTLLDHHNYSFEGAKDGLALCREKDILVVINSSKTFSECLDIQKQLELEVPLIVENGSALILPQSLTKSLDANKQELQLKNSSFSEIVFGVRRNKILEFISDVRLSKSWSFEGFNDWDLERVCDYTDLSSDEAKNAMQKEFSEPFIWQDSDENLLLFKDLAKDQGLTILKGGRFFHLQGDCNKATPLTWFKNNFDQLTDLSQTQNTLIAMGDNDNDIAMLKFADIAVCIKSAKNEYPNIGEHPNAYFTKQVGPYGWSEAIIALLNN